LIDPGTETIYKVAHLFSGIGGGALGFDEAHDTFRGLSARFRLVGAIDIDEAGNRDFERLTGRKPTYGDISKMKPADFRKACNGEAPDVIFTSPPCKGFSGLMSEEKSKTEKYKKLNRLVVQGLRLALDAFPEHPPALILLENVPRIAQRGRALLDRVEKFLKARGYVFHEGFHDCGEIGGLGQRRRRFLLVARLATRVPNVLHKPPSKNLRTIGDVLGPLPLPEDSSAGPMHRLPRLQWRTWLRLALIPAGGDWRDLDDYTPTVRPSKAAKKAKKKGGKQRALFGNAPKAAAPGDRDTWRPNRGQGAYGIVPWTSPSETVIGKGPGSGAMSVADPRVDGENYANSYRVNPWDEPAPTVTGQGAPSNGGVCVADPRLEDDPSTWPSYGVAKWDEPAACVTGQRAPGQGKLSVADPRLPSMGQHANKMRVEDWDEPAHTVVGSDRVGSGAPSVADPRIPDSIQFEGEGRNTKLRVENWDKPIRTIIGASDVQTGAPSVADPRVNGGHNGSYGVADWEEPAPTVTSGATPSTGRVSVADPRMTNTTPRFNDVYKIIRWDEPSGAVTGATGNAKPAVADPRQPRKYRNGAFQVVPFDAPAYAVTSKVNPSNESAQAVADPRLTCAPRSGTMEVLRWDHPATTVTSSGDIHAQGASAVADPRVADASSPKLPVIPEAHEQPENPPVIIALDGTWHRPLTTYELAALQSLPLTFKDGTPLVLDGNAQNKWRERIGNMVPPAAARAIATAMLRTLLVAAAGVMELSANEVWVLPQDENDPRLGVE
jgi:site-specific DNA-cytosine methylase